MTIKKGTIITAKQASQDGSFTIREYKVMQERLDKTYYRLINLKTDMIMSQFKTMNTNEIIPYIEQLGYGQEIISIK